MNIITLIFQFILLIPLSSWGINQSEGATRLITQQKIPRSAVIRPPQNPRGTPCVRTFFSCRNRISSADLGNGKEEMIISRDPQDFFQQLMEEQNRESPSPLLSDREPLDSAENISNADQKRSRQLSSIQNPFEKIGEQAPPHRREFMETWKEYEQSMDPPDFSADPFTKVDAVYDPKTQTFNNGGRKYIPASYEFFDLRNIKPDQKLFYTQKFSTLPRLKMSATTPDLQKKNVPGKQSGRTKKYS